MGIDRRGNKASYPELEKILEEFPPARRPKPRVIGSKERLKLFPEIEEYAKEKASATGSFDEKVFTEILKKACTPHTKFTKNQIKELIASGAREHTPSTIESILQSESPHDYLKRRKAYWQKYFGTLVLTTNFSGRFVVYEHSYSSLRISTMLDNTLGEHYSLDHDLVQAYFQNRAFLALTDFCIKFDLRLFFEGGALKKELQKKKNFLEAIKFEPAILQTQFGFEVLKNFSFLEPGDVATVGNSLFATSKRKTFGSSDQHALLKRCLLLLTTFEPLLLDLSDSALKKWLDDKGYVRASTYERMTYIRAKRQILEFVREQANINRSVAGI